MKQSFTLLMTVASLLLTFTCLAQDSKPDAPSGNVSATIFYNYHYDFSEGVEKKSQFELLRCYFGYQYQFSDKLSAKITMDVGNDGKTYAAYLRYGGFEWKLFPFLALEAGMINTHIWDVQEKLYNYRYILETQQDKDKFYSSGDLGVKATIKPFDKVELHAGLYNGEGYKKIQDDYGMHKVSFDVVAKPAEGLIIKAYYDIMGKKDTLPGGTITTLNHQHIVSVFAGYELKNKFRLGAEYNSQFNSGNVTDRELGGISAVGSVTFKKFELFARFDQLASNTLTGNTEAWNIKKDHHLIMGGIQYAPFKVLRMALNYRHYFPKSSSGIPLDLLYMNFEFKF